MKTIIAYRDNDLFARYMPMVIPLIAGIVEKIVFPVGATSLYQTLIQRLEAENDGFVYVSDGTCDIASFYSEKLQKMIGTSLIKKTRNLDDAFEAMVWHIIESSEKNFNYREVFKKIASLITGSQKIKTICAIEQHLTTHITNFKDHENVCALCNASPMAAENFIDNVIRETYPSAVIVKINEDDYGLLQKYGDEKECLVIMDRHCKPYRQDRNTIDNWCNNHRAKLFVLPPTQMVHSLFKQGILQEDFDPKILYQKIFR